ncbi:unnamed protein product [Parnassius mnemosyne]|uniref:Uncharacterized protein n=1 Tax=Parnassius mnemosyne TaxID=213953 RepID=A0AAV1LAI2_9NEOP
MTKGMLRYYNTSLLWARLLDIKTKRGNTNLTFEELEFCKSIMQHEYNVRQPIYLFSQLNNNKDSKSLTNHNLPVTVGIEGYWILGLIEDGSEDLRLEYDSIMDACELHGVLESDDDSPGSEWSATDMNNHEKLLKSV